MKVSVLLNGHAAALEALNMTEGFEAGLQLTLLIHDLEVVKEAFDKKQNGLIEKLGRAPDRSKEEEKRIKGDKFIPRDTPEYEEYLKVINEELERDVKFSYHNLDKNIFKSEKIKGGIVYNLMPFFDPPKKA